MNRFVVIMSFVLGFVLGGGIVYWHKYSEASSRYEMIGDEDAILQLEAEIEKLRQSKGEVLAENARLAERLATVKNFQAKEVAVDFKTASFPDRDSDESIVLDEVSLNQAEVRLKTLSEHLDLNDSQQDAFRELLTLNAQQQSAIKRALAKGAFQKGGNTIHLSPSDGPMLGPQDFEDLAKEVLDEDQLSKYLKMRSEEDKAKWEMVALSRLNRVAPILGLDEEERDLAYAVFYEESQTLGRQLTPEQREVGVELRNARLKEILGPEKFESYLNIGDGFFVKKIEMGE